MQGRWAARRSPLRGPAGLASRPGPRASHLRAGSGGLRLTAVTVDRPEPGQGVKPGRTTRAAPSPPGRAGRPGLMPEHDRVRTGSAAARGYVPESGCRYPTSAVVATVAKRGTDPLIQQRLSGCAAVCGSRSGRPARRPRPRVDSDRRVAVTPSCRLGCVARQYRRGEESHQELISAAPRRGDSLASCSADPSPNRPASGSDPDRDRKFLRVCPAGS